MKIWIILLVVGIILKKIYGRETLEEIKEYYDGTPQKDSMLVRYYAGGPPQTPRTQRKRKTPSRELPEHKQGSAKGMFNKEFLDSNSEDINYEEV
jgi:hypothetical protein